MYIFRGQAMCNCRLNKSQNSDQPQSLFIQHMFSACRYMVILLRLLKNQVKFTVYEQRWNRYQSRLINIRMGERWTVEPESQTQAVLFVNFYFLQLNRRLDVFSKKFFLLPCMGRLSLICKQHNWVSFPIVYNP